METAEAFDPTAPMIDWAEVFARSEWLVNEFLEWHLLGLGVREGAD